VITQAGEERIMDLKPDHIGLIVSDLERSSRFYEVLGFQSESVMEAQDGSRTIKFLRLGEFRLELFWSVGGSESAVAQGGDTRFRHLALRADDIYRARQELSAAGLMPEEAEVREVWGGLKLMYLTDPDGTEIEIMQRS
jgi:catechol 2,3-dioxygenase-like lactoylglutathione lyase family enzyme